MQVNPNVLSSLLLHTELPAVETVSQKSYNLVSSANGSEISQSTSLILLMGRNKSIRKQPYRSEKLNKHFRTSLCTFKLITEENNLNRIFYHRDIKAFKLGLL